jgi:structural maintenance of chromosomes protein 6
VENPVAVLDQEEAKKFLMGKAEDKYNFFMKATELERVDRTYSSTLDTIVDLHHINTRMKAGLKVSSDHVDELRKKWNEHQELGKLENKYHKCCTEFAWAVYAERDGLYAKTVMVRARTRIPLFSSHFHSS